MPDERLETLARRVIDDRRAYEAAHKKKVKAENAKKKSEAELHDALEKSSQTNTTLELGEGYGKIEFRRSKKTSASVFDKDAFAEWCKETKHDKAYLSTEPRKKPLNSLVKEYDENGQELPPGVEPRITKYVTVTNR